MATTMRLTDDEYMAMAVEEADAGIDNGGGPFGAVIVDRAGAVVCRAHNMVAIIPDATAHAEVVAIRTACRLLSTFSLEGCTLYTSCEPCVMCAASAFWSRVDRIVFGNSRQDAADIHFDDVAVFDEVTRPVHCCGRKIPMTQCSRDAAQVSFMKWMRTAERVHY